MTSGRPFELRPVRQSGRALRAGAQAAAAPAACGADVRLAKVHGAANRALLLRSLPSGAASDAARGGGGRAGSVVAIAVEALEAEQGAGVSLRAGAELVLGPVGTTRGWAVGGGGAARRDGRCGGGAGGGGLDRGRHHRGVATRGADRRERLSGVATGREKSLFSAVFSLGPGGGGQGTPPAPRRNARRAASRAPPHSRSASPAVWPHAESARCRSRSRVALAGVADAFDGLQPARRHAAARWAPWRRYVELHAHPTSPIRWCG